MRDGRLQRIEAIVEWQQRLSRESDDDRVLLNRKDCRLGFLGACRTIGCGLALLVVSAYKLAARSGLNVRVDGRSVRAILLLGRVGYPDFRCLPQLAALGLQHQSGRQ